MTRNTVNKICVSFLALVTAACGSADGAPFDEDLDLGEEVVGDEDANHGAGGAAGSSGSVGHPGIPGAGGGGGNPGSAGNGGSGGHDGSCTVDLQCDDGDACNGVETCQAGACVPGVPQSLFSSCDDGDAATDKDVCFGNVCRGRTVYDLAVNCSIGDCGCTGLTGVADLEYVPHEDRFITLINAERGLNCTRSPITHLYSVEPPIIREYFTTLPSGLALQGDGIRLSDGLALADKSVEDPAAPRAVGLIDHASFELAWSDTWVSDTLDAQADLGLVYDTASFVTGTGPGALNHLWFFGSEAANPNNTALVTCEYTCDGCVEPTPTCQTMPSVSSLWHWDFGHAYADGAATPSYGGAYATMNYGDPDNKIFVDPERQEDIACEYTDVSRQGHWTGLVSPTPPAIYLLGGDGTPNTLVYCDDPNPGSVQSCGPQMGIRCASAAIAPDVLLDAAHTTWGTIFLAREDVRNGGFLTSYAYVLYANDGSDPIGGPFALLPVAVMDASSDRYFTHVAASDTKIYLFEFASKKGLLRLHAWE